MTVKLKVMYYTSNPADVSSASFKNSAEAVENLKDYIKPISCPVVLKVQKDILKWRMDTWLAV